jgi:hypothetical protein
MVHSFLGLFLIVAGQIAVAGIAFSKLMGCVPFPQLLFRSGGDDDYVVLRDSKHALGDISKSLLINLRIARLVNYCLTVPDIISLMRLSNSWLEICWTRSSSFCDMDRFNIWTSALTGRMRAIGWTAQQYSTSPQPNPTSTNLIVK